MMMKANGFGSVFQEIIIRVDRDHVKKAQEGLDAEIQSETASHADLLWSRKTTRPGNDEDVVFEADMFMDIPDGSWSILWEQSRY